MSSFFPKSLVLKNGKHVLIREAQVLDAEKLLKCIKTYIPQSEYVPKLEEEIKVTIEQEQEWIQSFLDSPNSILLLAEYEGEVIGNIDLTGSRRKIMEHTAVIGMGMILEWRNSGLGSSLLAAVIEWARKNPILELLWLQVYTDNQLGLALYEKMGFMDNGTIKNFFKKDGQYSHVKTMSFSLK